MPAVEPAQTAPVEEKRKRGRPVGSRTKLSEAFWADLYNDWERYGHRAIARCRNKRADVYLKVIAQALPRDVNVNVSVLQRLASLPPGEIAQMREQVRQRLLGLSGVPSVPLDPSVVLDVPAAAAESVTTPQVPQESKG